MSRWTATTATAFEPNSAVTGGTVSSVADRRGPPRPPIARAWHGLTDRTTTAVDRIDGFQQRHRTTAIPSAVVRKYSDDQAGRLAAQISHSAFLAVFPMLLVLLTVVGIVLDGHRAWQEDVVNSALRQFPVIGSDLGNNVHQLSTTNTVALLVGLTWLVYGSMRLSRSAQVMMATVWGIDRDDLPSFGRWIPRAIGFLAVLGIGFIAGGALAGLGAFGGLGSWSAGIGLVLSLVVNVLMYWGGFSVVVKLPEDHYTVWPGALLGGLAWTLLQFAGAQLVRHQLRHLSNLYGTFATVLGLIWWIALGTMFTVYAAEFNVVLTRRLWPRSLRRPRAATGDRPPEGGDVGTGTGTPRHKQASPTVAS
jgi:YihY family inner membrane protein